MIQQLIKKAACCEKLVNGNYNYVQHEISYEKEEGSDLSERIDNLFEKVNNAKSSEELIIYLKELKQLKLEWKTEIDFAKAYDRLKEIEKKVGRNYKYVVDEALDYASLFSINLGFFKLRIKSSYKQKDVDLETIATDLLKDVEIEQIKDLYAKSIDAKVSEVKEEKEEEKGTLINKIKNYLPKLKKEKEETYKTPKESLDKAVKVREKSTETPKVKPYSAESLVEKYSVNPKEVKPFVERFGYFNTDKIIQETRDKKYDLKDFLKLYYAIESQLSNKGMLSKISATTDIIKSMNGERIGKAIKLINHYNTRNSAYSLSYSVISELKRQRRLRIEGIMLFAKFL